MIDVCPSPYLLYHRWRYNPIRTFASVMNFSRSTIFFHLSFHLLILHLLISVCIHFHHLFFGRSPSRLPWGLLLNTWLTFLLLSVQLTLQIQFNRLILTNWSISESPYSWINSSLYRFSNFHIHSLIPPNILLKTLLPNVANRLAISLSSIYPPTLPISSKL